MAMKLISFICLTFAITPEINGKTITIQVDFDDLIKLLSGINGDPTFRKYAKEIIKKSGLPNQLYNNPYHPEDDIPGIVDIKFEKNSNKKDSDKSQNLKLLADKKKKDIIKSENERKKENKVDAKIETDNFKFMSKPVTEDDLSDIASEVKNVQDSAKKHSVDDEDTKDDTKDFHIMQRRFVMKKNTQS